MHSGSPSVSYISEQLDVPKEDVQFILNKAHKLGLIDRNGDKYLPKTKTCRVSGQENQRLVLLVAVKGQGLPLF